MDQAFSKQKIYKDALLVKISTAQVVCDVMQLVLLVRSANRITFRILIGRVSTPANNVTSGILIVGSAILILARSVTLDIGRTLQLQDASKPGGEQIHSRMHHTLHFVNI